MSKIEILTEREAMESFDDMLDDCYPEYNIGYCSFSASEILKLDQVAYREGFLDYVNNMADDGVFYVEDYTDDLVEEDEDEENLDIDLDGGLSNINE